MAHTQNQQLFNGELKPVKLKTVLDRILHPGTRQLGFDFLLFQLIDEK